jgi:glyoxylase-like metal-dependent hydrolase (beta-lactamase superfamily II)
MSAGSIPFNRELEFEYGVASRLTPLVRRVVANNPSSFTLHGTNSYIVGHGEVAVIDPGPEDEVHTRSLLAALKGEKISHILVTHTHTDHSPGARSLAHATGAPVIGAHARPIDDGAKTVEAGEKDFSPDIELADGDSISGDGWTLSAVHTPGHMSNHHCFALAEENALFSGDHVMGWNTTIVSPPDGNMREYFASLNICLERDDAVYHPGHGPAIGSPKSFVQAYLDHRRMREEEITRCLEDGVGTITEMVRRMYTHLPETMYGAAARSVFAHMEHMVESGRAACDGTPAVDSSYRPA